MNTSSAMSAADWTDSVVSPSTSFGFIVVRRIAHNNITDGRAGQRFILFHFFKGYFRFKKKSG